MYSRSASLYDSLYHFKDYAEESGMLVRWIDSQAPGARTLLDVGCATGRHLEQLMSRFRCEGLDLNPEFVKQAQTRLAGVPIHLGDMRTFDLGRRFDVVTCLFSAIAMAATTEPELRDSIARMVRHLERPGLLIVEPWFTPEKYWTDTVTLNVADEGVRKIVWMYHSTRHDEVSMLDVHYLVGTSSGIESFQEALELGLFTDQQYRSAFEAAGLECRFEPGFGRGMYFGRRS